MQVKEAVKRPGRGGGHLQQLPAPVVRDKPGLGQRVNREEPRGCQQGTVLRNGGRAAALGMHVVRTDYCVAVD